MNISNYPILRLAIPLSTGIFLAWNFQLFLSIKWLLIGIIILILLIGVLLHLRSFRFRWCFGMLLWVLFLFVGASRMIYQLDKVHMVFPDSKQSYLGTIMEPPVEKPKSIWCKVSLYEGQSVYLYLAKDSLAKSLIMGDRLIFHAQLRKPSNEGLSFDYASYLLCKGVSGTAYVPTNYWTRMQEAALLTWKQKALLVREKIVNRYKGWGIGEKQLPVLSALTIGYKADLSDEIRDSYSVAGISHVLALSGMHIGFLWMMIGFLLKPLDKKGLQWIKWMISSCLLWMFAFVTGLEASVVRAVIMCMLMEFGRVLGNRTLSINTLAIAAFSMLLYNPFYLYDVGFQLSFLAVLFILLFYNRFDVFCPFRRLFFRKVWSILSVSMAAQLGTAPLIMVYFSNFSVYFLLANLGVALLVPCIIYTAFASMALYCLPWLHQWMIMLLDKMMEALNDFAGWISGLPCASLSVVNLRQIEVWGLYLLLGVAWRYSITRKRRSFIVLLASIAAWLALHCCLILK